jgi:hypothetical protein
MKMLLQGSSKPTFAQRQQQTQLQIQPGRIISSVAGQPASLRPRVPNPNMTVQNGLNSSMLFRISKFAPCGSCGGAK